MDAARAQAQDYVERRKGDAAQSVNDLAKTLRDSSRTFDDRPNIKAFFDSAAEGLEQLGGSIEARSFTDFYEDAEAFARRAPVAVAVGTFVAGFIAARFIKSSSLPQDREGSTATAPASRLGRRRMVERTDPIPAAGCPAQQHPEPDRRRAA